MEAVGWRCRSTRTRPAILPPAINRQDAGLGGDDERAETGRGVLSEAWAEMAEVPECCSILAEDPPALQRHLIDRHDVERCARCPRLIPARARWHHWLHRHLPQLRLKLEGSAPPLSPNSSARLRALDLAAGRDHIGAAKRAPKSFSRYEPPLKRSRSEERQLVWRYSLTPHPFYFLKINLQRLPGPARKLQAKKATSPNPTQPWSNILKSEQVKSLLRAWRHGKQDENENSPAEPSPKPPPSKRPRLSVFASRPGPLPAQPPLQSTPTPLSLSQQSLADPLTAPRSNESAFISP